MSIDKSEDCMSMSYQSSTQSESVMRIRKKFKNHVILKLYFTSLNKNIIKNLVGDFGCCK